MHHLPYYYSTVCRSSWWLGAHLFLAQDRADVTSRHTSLQKAAATKVEHIGPYPPMARSRIDAVIRTKQHAYKSGGFCCSTRAHGPPRIEDREEEKERVSLVLPSITAVDHIQHHRLPGGCVVAALPSHICHLFASEAITRAVIYSPGSISTRKRCGQKKQRAQLWLPLQYGCMYTAQAHED